MSKRTKESAQKLWGGRFGKEPDTDAQRFSASFQVDKRLYRHDIAGSIAHATMLGECGIITKTDARKIVGGLRRILIDIDSDTLALEGADEDIHSFVERVLTERIGDAAGRLHTARSRNDQIATDVRLWLKDATAELMASLSGLQAALVKQAECHTDTLLPGFTHLQHAQPVRLAHHLLAYFWMLERDAARLEDCVDRADVSPLGAAALAGTDFPIDPKLTAKLLGFSRIADNSMDAVSDRDFIVEFISALALLMTHLSRLCEELILWSTLEFSFVSLDESLCTGSSIMPQKKNPDLAELIRGKTGRVGGRLVNLLMIMKGLPLTYNTDLQEDKGALFDSFDTTRDSLALMAKLIATAEFNTERMRNSLRNDFSTATDLADYLVRQGVPFREAHRQVGELVARLLAQGKGLEDATADDLPDGNALKALSIEASADARAQLAGTGKQSVRAQLRKASRLLAARERKGR